MQDNLRENLGDGGEGNPKPIGYRIVFTTIEKKRGSV